MTNETEALLSHLSGRQVEAFYVLLVSSGRYTFLPELYEVFGRESTLKFLELFEGCSVRVPKLKRLERLAQQATVYVRIERATRGARPQIIHALSREYGISEDRIRTIHKRTKRKLEHELGFKAIKRRRSVSKKYG